MNAIGTQGWNGYGVLLTRRKRVISLFMVYAKDCAKWTTVGLGRPSRGTKANTIKALKNADSFLTDVMKAVDTNGDGNIQYSGNYFKVVMIP